MVVTTHAFFAQVSVLLSFFFLFNCTKMYTAKAESEHEHEGFSGLDLSRYLLCVF